MDWNKLNQERSPVQHSWFHVSVISKSFHEFPWVHMNTHLSPHMNLILWSCLEAEIHEHSFGLIWTSYCDHVLSDAIRHFFYKKKLRKYLALVVCNLGVARWLSLANKNFTTELFTLGITSKVYLALVQWPSLTLVLLWFPTFLIMRNPDAR